MYLFFDTETTGLPKSYKAPLEQLDNWPRLVQIAWLIYNENEQCLSKKDYIVKPKGFTIPQRATDIHGITTERALIEGTDLQLVLEEFAKDLSNVRTIIAHNLYFDEKIIAAEFLRNNVSHELFETNKTCTMKSSAKYCKIPHQYGGFKWPNLQELHIKLFNIPFKQAHNALADVQACANCYFKLKKLGVV